MPRRKKKSDVTVLPRRRLTSLLIAPEGGPVLSSVVAPSGFGKTTLLHAVRDVAADLKGMAAIYVDVEEAEQEAGVILDILQDAIEQSIPGVDVRPLESMRRGAPVEEYGQRLPYVLSRVFQSVDVKHVVLLLDNLHSLQPGEPITLMLAGLLQARPPQLHFVLASRHRHPIDPHWVRDAGRHLVLTAADLAFTAAEVDELVSPRELDEDTASWSQAIVDCTGGWPGIVVLTRDMFGTTDLQHAREFMSTLEGSAEAITDQVVGRILEEFDPSTQAFMKRLSVFSRITPLVQEMVEQLWNPKTKRFKSEVKPKSGATKKAPRAAAKKSKKRATAEVFETLLSSQILVPTSRDPESLEFAQLVRESLYRLLSAEEGEVVTNIHRVVGGWLVSQAGAGTLDVMALDHLIAGGQHEEAIDLLETNIEAYFHGAHQAKIRAWLGELDTVMGDLPYWANYYQGRAAATYGDWDLSRKALERCKQELLERKDIPRAWRWHAKVSMGFAWMYWRRGMQSETRTYCRRGLDYLAQAERRGLITKKDSGLAGEARLELLELLGVAKLATGAYGRAAVTLEEALGLAVEMGSARAEAVALSRLGLIAMRQGRHRVARDQLQRSVQLVSHDEDSDLFARSSYLLGFTLVMTGDFDDGIFHLHAAYDAVIESGRPTTVARTLTTIGRIYGSLGLIDEASDSFGRALDVSAAHQDIRVRVEVLDSYASALAYNNRPHEARVLLQQSSSLLSHRNRTDAHLSALHAEAQATLEASLGKYAMAIARVERAIERQRQLGGHYDAERLTWRMGMWLHQAFLDGEEHSPEEAFEILDGCCQRALDNGYIFEVGADAEALMYVGMCYGTEAMKNYCRELLLGLNHPVDDLGPLRGMSEETSARYKEYRRRADLDEEYVIMDREESRCANARQVNQLVDDNGDDHLVLLVPEQVLVHKGDDISLAEKRVILPLLLHFLRHPDGAFTMRELAEAVWGAQDSGSMQTKVKVAISRLRALLGKDRSYILTQKVDRGGERPVVAYGLDKKVDFYVVDRITEAAEVVS